MVKVLKESMVYGGWLINYYKADPLSAIEKDLHKTSSSAEYNPTWLLGRRCCHTWQLALSTFEGGGLCDSVYERVFAISPRCEGTEVAACSVTCWLVFTFFFYGVDDEGLTPTKDGGTCLKRLSMFRKKVR